MKNIEPKLVELLKKGNCTPLISQIAKKLKEPSTTIHYNIKKLENNKTIKSYKAVFDYKKINKGFCGFALIKLSPERYGNPEKIGEEIASYEEVESVDIVTGDFEIIIKSRVANQEEYYSFVKKIASISGIAKVFTLVSMHQLKTEFVSL